MVGYKESSLCVDEEKYEHLIRNTISCLPFSSLLLEPHLNQPADYCRAINRVILATIGTRGKCIPKNFRVYRKRV
jgi:hypothetical protein